MDDIVTILALLIALTAFQVICKVAHALHYCHTRDDPIVHRDLKPVGALGTVELSQFLLIILHVHIQIGH